MTVNLSANTPVVDIDVDDAWFMLDDGDKVALPGRPHEGGPKGPNVVTRKQARVIIRQLQNDAKFVVLLLGIAMGLSWNFLLAVLTLGEALGVFRGPQYANIVGKQYDLQMADYAIQQMRAANADQPLTPGQREMIATNVAAFAGTTPHFDSRVQKAIEALDDEDRHELGREFRRVALRGNQGDLDHLMQVVRPLIGDPAANRRRAELAAQRAVDDLDTSAETPTNWDDVVQPDGGDDPDDGVPAMVGDGD